MDTTQTSLPRSLILLIGPPRSGTTLIANAVMAHSTVAGVMEPYQRWRHDGMEETRLPDFLTASGTHDLTGTPHLVVKETTTRLRNVELSLALMQEAAAHGLYRGLVLILRCPLTGYLSQVEASQKYWSEKKMSEETQASFLTWATAMRLHLRKLCWHARAQHHRLVGYERFCADPEAELARLMALIPERLEPRQLAFRSSAETRGAGDPKVHEKSGGISVTDRAAQMDALKTKYAALPEMRFLLKLQEIVLGHVGQEDDRLTLDRLTRLLA